MCKKGFKYFALYVCVDIKTVWDLIGKTKAHVIYDNFDLRHNIKNRKLKSILRNQNIRKSTF